MRVNPEIYIVEDADGFARVSRQHRPLKSLKRPGLPGAWAHVEYPGKAVEQERPIGNRPKVGAGALRRGKTAAVMCQRPVGVGPFHSSHEVREGGGS